MKGFRCNGRNISAQCSKYTVLISPYTSTQEDLVGTDHWHADELWKLHISKFQSPTAKSSKRSEKWKLSGSRTTSNAHRFAMKAESY